MTEFEQTTWLFLWNREWFSFVIRYTVFRLTFNVLVETYLITSSKNSFNDMFFLLCKLIQMFINFSIWKRWACSKYCCGNCILHCREASSSSPPNRNQRQKTKHFLLIFRNHSLSFNTNRIYLHFYRNTSNILYSNIALSNLSSVSQYEFHFIKLFHLNI